MTDNSMNLNNTPEQELEAEQLEQVSGGVHRLKNDRKILVVGDTDTDNDTDDDTNKGNPPPQSAVPPAPATIPDPDDISRLIGLKR